MDPSRSPRSQLVAVAVALAGLAALGGCSGMDPMGKAHADPATFRVISEGMFSGQSEIISVEGAARITIAVAASPAINDPSCHGNWRVPGGALASERFNETLASAYLPMNDKRSDVVGPLPVVLPKIQLSCNFTGPVTYVVYGIN